MIDTMKRLTVAVAMAAVFCVAGCGDETSGGDEPSTALPATREVGGHELSAEPVVTCVLKADNTDGTGVVTSAQVSQVGDPDGGVPAESDAGACPAAPAPGTHLNVVNGKIDGTAIQLLDFTSYPGTATPCTWLLKGRVTVVQGGCASTAYFDLRVDG